VKNGKTLIETTLIYWSKNGNDNSLVQTSQWVFANLITQTHCYYVDDFFYSKRHNLNGISDSVMVVADRAFVFV